jgi:cell fate regulator YaaT (PSP1 superfamily)
VTITATRQTCLVRYGTVPEVARFTADGLDPLPRGTEVVVRTHRGLQVGSVLEVLRSTDAPPDDEHEADLLRVATDEDLALRNSLRAVCEAEFDGWCRRIRDWHVDLDLLDLECTLDGEKKILYVLSDRGPGATQLALQAAAKGLGIIEVQPVAADGPIPLDTGGGCGTGGGGCGCSH